MTKFHPQIFGRYLLVSKLGSGGMAEVYRAKIFGIDGFEKQLAIKRILSNYSEDRQFIDMLINEAKLSVQLNHTNIVQVYDFGKIGDDYFMAMEFIMGVNLHEILGRLADEDRLLPEEISVYIINEVCRGLDYAHFKKGPDGLPLGVIHRDISPPNILISYEGEVKVGDFGIAKAAMNSSHTMTGIIKGKISYMSPEQARGEPLDNRSDIFSVGMVLYELLTGKRLFTGDTQFEVLHKIQKTQVQEKDLDESIAPQLRKILAKSLAFHQDDRYPTAGHFQSELSRYLNTVYPSFTSRELRDLVEELFSKEIELGKERVEKEDKVEEKLTVVKQFRESQKRAPPPREFVPKSEAKKPAKIGKNEIFPTKVGYFSVPTRKKSPPWFFIAMGSVPVIVFILWLLVRPHQTEEMSAPEPPPQVVKNQTTVTHPPPAATQGSGKIMIESIPDGAIIYLDGKETYEKTPALLDHLKVGKSLQLTLKKSGFEDWTQAMILSDTDPVSLKPLLNPISKAIVVVSTDPPGAKIFLNNEDTGKTTPAILEEIEVSKPYRMRLELANFVPLDETFTLSDDTPLKMDRSLTQIPTKKPVSSTPARTQRSASHKTSTPTTSTTTTTTTQKNPNAAQTMGKGFKKAGSSIKGFFTGGNKEEKKPDN